MNIKPMKGQVQIKEVVPQDTMKTESGILLTQPLDTSTRYAAAVAVGEGVTDVNVGDIVIPIWNHCKPIPTTGTLIVGIQSIVAVME